jgi:thioredoxin-dependent peroxiredoxin
MALTVGTKAPDFTVNDQDGKSVKLSDLKGKKVVLYFYPKDMTPGCTFEACSLRDNYKALQKAGYEIFGISSDNEKMHRKFIEQQKLPFQLLADTDKAVHYKYVTWVEKSMYGRTYMGTARVTYIIDENGIISEVIEKVDTKNHASQILGGTPPAVSKASTITPKKAAAKKVVKSKPVKKPAPKKVKKAAKKKK